MVNVQWSMFNEQSSSYFQLLIHKSNLQSCLCQYVKDRRTLNIKHETLNSRGCQHTMWRISGSNRWPLACHASALANWANPPNRPQGQCKNVKMTKCKKDSRQHYYIITFFNSYIAADSAAVVPGRLELPTSTLSVWRSNQLSYRTVQAAWVSTQLLSILYHTKQSQKHKKQKGLSNKPSLLP